MSQHSENFVQEVKAINGGRGQQAIGCGRGQQMKIIQPSPPTFDQEDSGRDSGRESLGSNTPLLRHQERPTVELSLRFCCCYEEKGKRQRLLRLVIGCPQVPLRTLYEIMMLHSSAAPLRVIATNALFEANFLCYGLF